jgi:hypothetical protein
MAANVAAGTRLFFVGGIVAPFILVVAFLVLSNLENFLKVKR